jgi:hypothetical protein
MRRNQIFFLAFLLPINKSKFEVQRLIGEVKDERDY